MHIITSQIASTFYNIRYRPFTTQTSDRYQSQHQKAITFHLIKKRDEKDANTLIAL